MKYKMPIILIISAIIVLISLNVGIFWDNVLFVSKMGNSLFENGIFKWSLIPLESDSGQPPFLATLMAFSWNLFGKSLTVSHWVMFPFIFGLLWQIASFVNFFVKVRSLQVWAFLLIVSDPTLLSQLVLVSPEVIQLFFFFLSLNGVLRNNVYLKITGLFFLGIVTLRGMMLCVGIFVIDLLIHLIVRKKNARSFFQNQVLFSYLISAIPAVAYIVWRLVTKGWITSHPLEIWGNAWEFSSFQEFVKNIAINFIVLGHRFVDFGRIIPALFVLITLIIKRKSLEWEKIIPVILIIFFSTVVVYITSLLINNPMGHRYYIPSYLSLGLLSFLLIKEYKNKKIIYTGLLCSLMLGNFIVYPDRFSQGWDSSLAHLPYWDLRRSAIGYLDTNHISISKTASFFPNNTTIDNVDLNKDLRSFVGFSGTEKYVFYSNVYNLSDEDLKILHQNYYTLKLFENLNVRIEIMQKKE